MSTATLPLMNESFSSGYPTRTQIISSGIPIHLVIHAVISFIIASIGIIANGIVIVVILRSRKLRTMNTFMLFCNLAIADFLLSVTIPFNGAIMLNQGYFYYGPFLCKALPVLQTTVIIVSGLTIYITSIDRSLAVAKPYFFEHWVDNKAIGIAIGLTWIVGFAFAAPQLHYLILTPLNYCYIAMVPLTAIIYQIVGIVMQFMLPLFGGIASYIIVNRVFHKFNSLPYHLQPDQNQLLKAKRRANTVLTVLIVYIGCSLGFSALSIAEVALRSRFKADRQLHFIMYNLLFAFRMVAYSSSVWNPFIYAVSSQSFRQSLYAIGRASSVGTTPFKSTSSISRDSIGHIHLKRRDYFTAKSLAPPSNSIATSTISSDRQKEEKEN